MGVSDTFKSWQAGACSWQAYGKLGPDSWCRVRTVQSGLVLRHVKCLGRPTNLRTRWSALSLSSTSSPSRHQWVSTGTSSQEDLAKPQCWPMPFHTCITSCHVHVMSTHNSKNHTSRDLHFFKHSGDDFILSSDMSCQLIISSSYDVKRHVKL